MPQLTDVTRKRRFSGKLWALIAPYFFSGEGLLAVVLLATVIAMALAGVYVDYLLNVWTGDFNNVLQAKDLSPTDVSIFGYTITTVNHFVYIMGKFAAIVFPWVIIAVYSTYLQQMLQIRWRRWMTERLIGLWLADRTYYRLQIYGGGTDNPEQRIEEDIDSFTDVTLQLIIGFIQKVAALAAFVPLLWELSGPITLPMFGMAVTIPGHMVWLAILYAAFGTYVSYRIGRPLVRINFEQQRFRANFRYGMSRLKDNAESVAMYGGERHEQRNLMNSFAAIWSNWWQLMRQQKRLNWFQSFFGQSGQVFPILVIAPRYFSGAIDFGTIFRVGQAFGQVSSALTWFMDVFVTLTEWKATVNRLIGFVEATERVKTIRPDIAVTSEREGVLEATNLGLILPDGRKLIDGLSAKIESGQRVLISGPSGSGKTTLFRALAGLWPFGKGNIHLPANAKTLFLPQRPYLPLGTLREAIAYPGQTAEVSADAICDSLKAVNLAHLESRLEEQTNWSMSLSIGEQQRLAIARVLLQQPDWLYLDEATSALDAANEQRMYQLLSERLPNTTILSIAHRPEVAKYHLRRLTIDPETRSATMTPIAAE
jgi:putative ATP-binding cassette transporter